MDELVSQVEIFDDTTDKLKEIIKFVSGDSITRQAQRSSIVTPLSISKHSYKTGAFNFSNNIWINGGGTFRNPVDVQITPKG